MVFAEPGTGFATSDVRDADEQIVQFNSAGELIWKADDTRLPGYHVRDGIYIPSEVCGCWLEVRFGIRDGERRAYLTADYGHDNPGTIVDLEIAGGALTVSRTALYPPGTFTLSGVVFETTPGGRVPIQGATVSRSYGSGWQNSTTDDRGFYSIPGLYTRTDVVSVGKPGYERKETTLPIGGDTRFDIELVRQ